MQNRKVTMKVIMIDACFECPFCTPAKYDNMGMTYKCKKTGVILKDERTTIDFRCTLDSMDRDEINLLTMIEQTYLDIEESLKNAEEGEDTTEDRIIYEFLKDSLGFLDDYKE